jgi:hypothetical protein
MTWEGNSKPKKFRGRIAASPICFLLTAFSASSCRPFLLSFWLPWFYSPFHFFDGSCNDLLLQLVECIESIKSDVKKKMTLMKHATGVPKSLHIIVQLVFSLDRDLISNSIVMLSPSKS